MKSVVFALFAALAVTACGKKETPPAEPTPVAAPAAPAPAAPAAPADAAPAAPAQAAPAPATAEPAKK